MGVVRSPGALQRFRSSGRVHAWKTFSRGAWNVRWSRTVTGAVCGAGAMGVLLWRRRIVKARVILGAIALLHSSLDDWLRHRPRTTVVAIGLGLVAALGYADASVAPDLAPLVYLAPIAVVAWYAGRWAGALVALTSTGAWLLTDAAGRGLPSAMVLSWDALVRLAAFLVVAVMMAALRESLDRERRVAPTDPLTGVGNARALYEAAGAGNARAPRHQRPLTPAHLDLDDFKNVNDPPRHAARDPGVRS